jgi:hypothetical protein
MSLSALSQPHYVVDFTFAAELWIQHTTQYPSRAEIVHTYLLLVLIPANVNNLFITYPKVCHKSDNEIWLM